MRGYVRFITCAFLYLWVSQVVLFAAIQRPGNDYARARLTDLVDGTGYRPFVFRALLPATVRVAVLLTPPGWQDSLQRRWHNGSLFKHTPANDEAHVFIYSVAYFVEGLSLLAWLIVLRKGLLYFYGDGGWVLDFLPALAAMFLPCLFRYVHYDYDFPQLLVFTLALLLMARERWLLFYPVLLLAALSKETALLLPIIFVLNWRRGHIKGSTWLHPAGQLALVLGVRAWLQFVVFANNPGEPVEDWWQRNMEFLSAPHMVWRMFFWFAPVGTFHVILPTTWNVLFLAAIPLLIWHWGEKPRFLRRAVWIAPLLIVLMIRWGQVDEIRIFYELIPILFWIIAHTFMKIVPETVAAVSAK